MSGLASLLPPIVALVVAAASRRVLPALALGGITGTVLLAAQDGGWWTAVPAGLLGFVRLGILGQAADASHAQMLVLIALISGFVHLLDASGSARALIGRLANRVRTPAQAQLATWAGGLVLFFSDFGNVLILGPMFGPLYDRVGLSRERLAWIIDTTAAPVCVLVPFIAWGVFAAGLIEAALPGSDGFVVLVSALPYQLYPWLSLAFVPLMALAGRAFGPMARTVPRTEALPAAQAASDVSAGPAFAAFLMLFLTLMVVGATGIYTDGRVTGEGVRVALGAAYLVAIGVLWAGLGVGADALWRGVGNSAPLLGLLLLAWTLGEVCGQLGTGAFLARTLGDALPAAAVPVAIFLLGAVMSFATGTSWGTFAILMPIGIGLAQQAGVPVAAAVGAVLSGGVFGDHVSPISDTTLLASAAAETDHGSHVSTQLPLAISVGIASGAGFIVAGTAGASAGFAAGLIGLGGVVAASRVWARVRDMSEEVHKSRLE